MQYYEKIEEITKKIKEKKLNPIFKIEGDLNGNKVIIKKKLQKKEVFDYVIWNLPSLLNFEENIELNNKFWEIQGLENIKFYCYKIKSKEFKKELDEITENLFPFFLDSEGFNIEIENGNVSSLKLNGKIINGNYVSSESIRNHIGFQELKIIGYGTIKFRVFPKKNDFYESIDKILQKIDKTYFGGNFSDKNVGGKGDYKLIDNLLSNENSQKLKDKIQYFFNKISSNPIKKTKLVPKFDIAKKGLNKQNLQAIYHQQTKLLPGEEEKHKQGINKRQNINLYGQEINLKNVKQYEKVDDYDIAENRYVKKLIHKNMMEAKTAEQKRFFNVLLNKGFLKDVKLDLGAKKTSKITLNLNYSNLEKYLKNFLKVDILTFLNQKNIDTFDNLYEIYCFIKLGEFFSSDYAKTKGWEVVGSLQDIYKEGKFKNCDKMDTSNCNYCLNLRYNQIDVKLTFGGKLNRKNIAPVTPDYILDYGDKKIILDAKYSIAFYQELNTFGVVSDRIIELYQKYYLDADNNENVKGVIILYPFKDIDDKLLQVIDFQTSNNIVMFPIEEYEENENIIEKFFNTLEKISK